MSKQLKEFTYRHYRLRVSFDGSSWGGGGAEYENIIRPLTGQDELHVVQQLRDQVDRIWAYDPDETFGAERRR